MKTMRNYYARYNPKGFANTGEWIAFESRAARDSACQKEYFTAYTRKEVRAHMLGERKHYGHSLYSFNLYIGSQNYWEDTNRRENAQDRLNQFFTVTGEWIDGIAEQPVRI